jgi:hypothetical protein
MSPASTALGSALREWRAALVDELGGPDTVSTQRLALVDLAVATNLGKFGTSRGRRGEPR